MRPPAPSPRPTPTGVRVALIAAAGAWLVTVALTPVYGGSWSDVLLAAFVGAFFLQPIVFAALVPTRKRRPLPCATGLCRVCGYSRQGLQPKSICPECGHLPNVRL